MSDIPISWKRITRGLPKVRRYADDRAPTLEEIQKVPNIDTTNQTATGHKDAGVSKYRPKSYENLTCEN
jgi:hypothetical protein